MASSQSSKYLTLTATITLALATALSASTALSFYMWRRKSRSLESKVVQLEKSLKSSLDKCCAERQGRIRAQQVRFFFSSDKFSYFMQIYLWVKTQERIWDHLKVHNCSFVFLSSINSCGSFNFFFFVGNNAVQFRQRLM